ncbi:MAG: metallophosphoesterase [Lachnospiraceae bacterium]
MRYYIADCHFGHDRARILDNRDFNSVEQMDSEMVSIWNKIVRKKKDEVVILGDLSVLKGEEVNNILKQLNGRKYLVAGNHDMRFLHDKKFDVSLFEWIKPYAELRDNNRTVVLSHYPVICYNGQYKGDKTYMLYGHVHNTADYQNVKRFVAETRKSTSGGINIPCNMINCFTVFSGYRPLTLDEWIEIQEKL